MGRKLKEIEVEEISLVDAASNRKKFYIVKKDDTKKQKAQISIESDGTVKGTKILMGDEEVKNLVDFSFSFYQPRSGEGGENLGKNVSCSYSKVTETEDGFKHTDHFYLSKSLEVKQMKELKEIYKDLIGEEFSEEQIEKAKKLSEEARNVIKKALSSLGEYKDDMPQDLKDAVKALVKNAIGSGASIEEAQESKEPYKLKEVLEVLEKAHLAKAGAKLSKNTRQQIQKAIDALKKLLELDEGKGKGDGELKKELEEIKDSIKKLGEKGKDGDFKEELDKITKRLETIEKAKGIKKSIDSDEDGDGKEKPKWPGFFPED